jgi:hypothetical protein
VYVTPRFNPDSPSSSFACLLTVTHSTRPFRYVQTLPHLTHRPSADDAALRNRSGVVSLSLSTPLVGLRGVSHHSSDRDPLRKENAVPLSEHGGSRRLPPSPMPPPPPTRI